MRLLRRRYGVFRARVHYYYKRYHWLALLQSRLNGPVHRELVGIGDSSRSIGVPHTAHVRD